MSATLQTESPPAAKEKKALLFWLPLLIVAALLVGIYGHIVLGLVDDWWNDPKASHGLLVPPLAAYIAWKRKHLTLSIPAAPDLRGLFWILGGCVVLLIGKLGAEFFLGRISLVILLAGFVYTFWGKQRLRALCFPLLLLATMVPLPVIVYNQLAQPLQLFASQVSTKVAQSFGVSVYTEGNVIQLATTTLGVAEACSGLHSLAALTIMALLLGFIVCRRPLARVLLLALSLPHSCSRERAEGSGYSHPGGPKSRPRDGLLSLLLWLAYLSSGHRPCVRSLPAPA